jgi:hypothetical protein
MCGWVGRGAGGPQRHWDRGVAPGRRPQGGAWGWQPRGHPWNGWRLEQRCPGTPLPADQGRVRLVSYQQETVAAPQRRPRSKVGKVSIHREQRVRDDQLALACSSSRGGGGVVFKSEGSAASEHRSAQRRCDAGSSRRAARAAGHPSSPTQTPATPKDERTPAGIRPGSAKAASGDGTRLRSSRPLLAWRRPF